MKQRIILFFSFLLFSGYVFGQERMVCDETCEVGDGKTSAVQKGESGYAVVSPDGRGTVEPIRQAPRLQTLNGKTIAVVGVSFMSRVTHPEIKRLITKHYPTARVLLLDEVGTAGPYPAPGITRRAKDDFQQRLRELKVDAVIAGNGGCGLCTPKEVGSCLAAEYIGIPSVIICAPGFTTQARYTALNNGMPVMRVAEYPIVPPTFERVNEMMRFTDYRWDETVAVLPIAHRNTTTWHVAVNGVMAGCKPELMPILIALTKALGGPDFRRTLKERAFANYYANPGGAKDSGEHNLRQYTGHLRRTEGAAQTVTPEWYDSPDATIETIPTMRQGMTQFLITGDAARNKLQTMPGGGYSTMKIAAKKIDTPDGVLHYREACIDAANDNKPALVIYMHGATCEQSFIEERIAWVFSHQGNASGIKALLREPRAETFVTLSGLRTNTPRRGVVINDGKKIIK